MAEGKEGTTELGTTKRTRVLQAPWDMATLLLKRLEQQSEWTSLSRSLGYTDYSQVSATPIHARALTSLIVPQTCRDFSGEVFEVFHCLVEDLEALPDADDIFYDGCPICKKKRGPESTCTHQEKPQNLHHALPYRDLRRPSASSRHWSGPPRHARSVGR